MTETLAEPSKSPLQLTVSCAVVSISNTFGSNTVTDVSLKHPF